MVDVSTEDLWRKSLRRLARFCRGSADDSEWRDSAAEWLVRQKLPPPHGDGVLRRAAAATKSRVKARGALRFVDPAKIERLTVPRRRTPTKAKPRAARAKLAPPPVNGWARLLATLSLEMERTLGAPDRVKEREEELIAAGAWWIASLLNEKLSHLPGLESTKTEQRVLTVLKRAIREVPRKPFAPISTRGAKRAGYLDSDGPTQGDFWIHGAVARLLKTAAGMSPGEVNAAMNSMHQGATRARQKAARARAKAGGVDGILRALGDLGLPVEEALKRRGRVRKAKYQ